jgi:hypothetical protein
MVWLQVLWQVSIIGLFWRNQCSYLPNYVVSYPIGQQFSYSQPPVWDSCISGVCCFPSCPHTVQAFVFYTWYDQVLRFCSVCIKWWFPPSTYAVIDGPVLHLHCKYIWGLSASGPYCWSLLFATLSHGSWLDHQAAYSWCVSQRLFHVSICYASKSSFAVGRPLQFCKFFYDAYAKYWSYKKCCKLNDSSIAHTCSIQWWSLFLCQ